MDLKFFKFFPIKASSGVPWIDDLAITLLAESLAGTLDDREFVKENPEANTLRKLLIRPQEDIIDNLKYLLESKDFGGHRFLPTGLVQEMEKDVNEAWKNKATLHDLYNEYERGAHTLMLNLVGHGVFLDQDKEGLDWMKEKDITREDMEKLNWYESAYDSALGFIEAWTNAQQEEAE